MNRNYLHIVLFLFTPWLGLMAKADAIREDSIKAIIYNRQTLRTDKIRAMTALAKLKKESDPVEAKMIAEKAIDEAFESSDKKLLAESFLVMAEVEEKNNLDSAIAHYNYAIDLFDPITEKSQIARALNQRGILYENKGLYTKAYASYISSLRLYDELKDEKGICNEYLNIGLIHQYKREYKQAQTYFIQSLLIAKRLQYPGAIASALNNLGIVHREQKEYAQALSYFKQVLAMDMRSGNISDIAYSLNNVGAVMADMNQNDSALKFYRQSIALKQKQNDWVGLANSYNNTGALLVKIKRLQEAEDVLKKAEQIALRQGLQNTLAETYHSYYELEKGRNHDKEALSYFVRYQTLKDSLDAGESNLVIHDMENQYKLDKANLEIERQNEAIESALVLRVLFLVIIFLLALLSLYFFYSIRHTRKLYAALNEQNEDLTLAKEKAENATNAKTQFLSIMSHEIRTPLNAIIGIANLLNEDIKNEEHRENISVLRIASQNLLHLINDLLDLNKLEVGKMEAEHVQLNVRKVVEAIREMFAVSATQKGIALKLEFDYRIPSLLVGDETKLNQAVTNLVSNAIKFTERGSVTIGVSMVATTTEYTTIEFSVADTGIGIPHDKQQTIFESFTQAGSDTNRKYGGTGLGLSISQKLVDVMGGNLQVKSELHHGSVFSFTLSLLHDQVKYQKPAIEMAGESDVFAGKRILIADDNAVNIFVLKQFLRKWNITVVEVENGLEALNMLRSQPFDLVLMDIQMPLKDGIDATMDIRKEGKEWSAIPIIAITASQEDEIREKIKQCGMNDFIIKPFMPNDLFEKLSKYLQ